LLTPPAPTNTTQVDVAHIPIGSDNPHGNGFVQNERDLLTVHSAMRDVAGDVGRTWKMKNPGVRHPVTGAPVAYKLLPSQSECPALAVGKEGAAGRGALPVLGRPSSCITETPATLI
jgi:Cu2+-containing amine oxidase